MQTRVVLCEMGIKCLYPLEEHMQRQSVPEWLDLEKKLANKKESQEQLLGTL
jgi:hypothetical protein